VGAANSNPRPSYEHGDDIRDRTFRFACRVLAVCEDIYNAKTFGRLLVMQLTDCSTSTTAMLEEARAAESPRDFVSKCSIALKECRESWTRLRILEARRIGNIPEVSALVREADELVAIITTIVANARRRGRS
jgi:four helix bundle protein